MKNHKGTKEHAMDKDKHGGPSTMDVSLAKANKLAAKEKAGDQDITDYYTS